jgi:hypothetical protein
MPRHRLEREPRHRAQRPAQERPRRAKLRAATARPSGHRKPGTGGSNGWQAAAVGASDRLFGFGARFRPYRKSLLTGAVRGLIVSPWFAAGAGFVVAAGAFLYAPHAQLSFGNPLVHRSPCAAARCEHDFSTEQGARGTLGTGVEQVPANPASSATAATTGMTFGYAVTSHNRAGFQMLLTVTGKKAIGNWTLSFLMPGATDVTVLEATPVDPATGTPTPASTPSGSGSTRTTMPSPEPSPGFSASPTAAHGVDSADTLYLVVKGDGAPAAPADCTFDGVPSSFSQSQS